MYLRSEMLAKHISVQHMNGLHTTWQRLTIQGYFTLLRSLYEINVDERILVVDYPW